MKPLELLITVKEIEKTIGREPESHNDPRPIDIDVLLYGNEIVNTTGLVIPHPRMTERAFVLIPLADIASDLIHPVSGKRIKELLEALKISTDDIVRCENI
jgi:2-amino-4-hydroxy-6-hydroxymethyldihydropteridine diphosphokinase